MEELETKLAKIQLGNPKNTTSFVYSIAEQAPNNTSELYVLAELPLFNPAASQICENICLAIAAALRRSYRKPTDTTTFENAVTVINDELGKLAEMGQTGWVDKLNCIIGVKDGNVFNIATTGKVAAYLFRDGEFIDISTSSDAPHPLKTFESVAAGKITLQDILILSTTQLFNHLAISRLKDILESHDFLVAIQTIIQILKDNAGPEIAFGSLFAQQVPFGEAPEEVEIENYEVEQTDRPSVFATTIEFLKKYFAMGSDATKRIPKVNLPAIKAGDHFTNLTDKFKNFIAGKGFKNTPGAIMGLTKQIGSGAAQAFHYSKNKLDVANFQQYSRLKKMVLVAAALMFVAFGINLYVSYHYKQEKVATQKTEQNLGEIQTLVNQSQSYLLFKNDQGALTAYQSAIQKFPKKETVPDSQLAQWDDINSQLADLRNKFEKITTAQVTTLGSLTTADSLMKFPEYVGTQTGGSIVVYNKKTGSFEDGTLLSSEPITLSTWTSGTNAVVYNGSSLFTWDYAKRQLGPGFNQNVPSSNDVAGLAYYPTNQRVYMVNKAAKQIVNFQINNNSLRNPVVAVRDNSLTNAQDLAIDGSIYVLTNDTILKFLSGKPSAFTFPTLLTPYSGKGKLYTDKDIKNIYLLDKGNNRIVVMDKKGTLVAIYKSDQFGDLKDFQVDEKAKIIYILNGNSLLRVNF